MVEFLSIKKRFRRSDLRSRGIIERIPILHPFEQVVLNGFREIGSANKRRLGGRGTG